CFSAAKPQRWGFFDQLTSFTHGQFEVWATTPDLGNLSTLEEASIMVRGGGEVEISNLTSLSFTTARTWTSRDSGSRLVLPDLVNLTGPEPESGTAFLKLEAWSAGLIELPSLTTFGGGIHFSSRETGAEIDLPVLAGMSSSNTFASKIEPRNGGNITFNNATFENVDVDLITGGTLTGSTMSFASNCLLRGEGAITANVSFSGKIELATADVPISINGSLTLDGTSIVNPTLGLGTDKKQSGRLNVSDNVVLGGTLDVKQLNAWLPELDDEVIVVFSAADSMTGAFATVTGLTDDATYDLSLGQTTSQITLKVIPKP
ncbi:MAG: hypothetical protein O3C43_22900, partial [Verrucomicrobia bacterium]|nr:hypothetical protein [Verrucomicrobiota bacterium]